MRLRSCKFYLVIEYSQSSHIVEAQKPINMALLCGLIERLSTQLVVHRSLQQKGSLHSVMLPRTWLCGLLSDLDLDEARRQECPYFWPLLRPLNTLLRRLLFPTGKHSSTQGRILSNYSLDQSSMKITPDFRSVDRQPISVRGIFIARM